MIRRDTMIENVAYGDNDEDEEYFVQTVCGEEHLGQHCDCNVISTHNTLTEAKERAHVASKILRVPVKCWYGNNEPTNSITLNKLTPEQEQLIREYAFEIGGME